MEGAPSDPAPARPALETWLRSPARRALLVVALIALATAATTFQGLDLAEARGREAPVGRILLHQLSYWVAWAAVGLAVTHSAAWLWERGGPVLFLVVQIPLSVGVGAGFRSLYEVAGERIAGSFPRGPRGDAAGRRDALGPGDPRFWRDRAGRPGPREDERRERMRHFSDRWRLFRLQREILIYWVVLALGMGTRAFLAARDRERAAAELEMAAERLKSELLHAQVDALRAELNPHFLFNALHSVGGLVRSGQRDAALAALAGVGDLLRATLARGETQESDLCDEVELARRFLDLERVRFGERLRVSIDVPPGLGRARVPSLVLLPLVENAVRYGVEPRPEGGSVELRARARGDELVVCVHDDGPGFPPAALAAGSRRPGGGIGLSNTRARLSMLYGQRARLELENPEGGGATARLVLPRGGSA